jgi:acetoin utilization protein AcuB
LRTLETWKIRHLPVVEGDRLVGIVSDRDLKKAAPSPFDRDTAEEFVRFTSAVTVKEVMSKEVVTTSPHCPIEEAAALMFEKRIGALPVVQEGRLVGIITETDVLEAFVEAMGIRGSCSRVEIVVEDTPAALYAIGDIVRERAGDIASIMTARATYRGEERKVLIVRIETDDPEETVKAIEKAGYPVLSAAV